jgi:uncharacterized membrane protein
MRVSNGIRIAASPNVVWAVTTDVERWPEWTPTVKSVKRLDAGPLRAGSVARIAQPMQPVSDWTVTEFDEGRRFAWETHRPGMRMKGWHVISDDGGGTKNVLHLDAHGPLAVLLWPLLRPAIARALADENRGLKRRCETGTAPGPPSGT